MSSGIHLIVGLGNPGPEYEHTRHNAGAWFVLDLAHKTHSTLRFETIFQGLHCVARKAGHEFHLLIPATFMNLSGQSVKAVATFYKIKPEKILVVHDELDLVAGDVRLKFDGGHGGHNGLRDIIAHLGTNQFHRLRVGIGHPGKSHDVTNYVLKQPGKSERAEIDMALDKATQALPHLLEGEFQKAMQDLHSKN